MIFLELWSRQIGIPYDEYAVMPIGEIHDMIAGYQIINGTAKEVEEKFIPSLR